MIVPDVNLLLYAYNKDSRFHDRAKRWLTECLSGSETVGLSWIVIIGFIRVATSSRVFANPLKVSEAVGSVKAWLARPQVQLLDPGVRHAGLLFGFLTELGTGGNLTSDAHLAALTVEYQAVLHTTDLDFARFSGVRWTNPIA